MSVAARLDVTALRSEFPILGESVHGRPLAYLDNAATTQKPRAVLEAIDRYYHHENANVHRGVHELSQRATALYEDARARIAAFIGAEAREVVFTRGTTESINLVAAGFAAQELSPGDEILLTELEHHSNIVPWQLACRRSGAVLRVLPIDDRGAIHLDDLERMLGPRTRIVAVTHVSNALGTVNPVREIARRAHAHGVPVLVDAAQSVVHRPLDVRELECDFLAFSGHKMYGPTGIGVLWGSASWLDRLPPYQGGGDMIRTVTFAESTFADLPHKFEAGTPHIAGAIGLGAAVDFLSGLDREAVREHEQDLLQYAQDALGTLTGVRLVGTAEEKESVVSFVIAGVHAHDVGTLLDREGIAVRAGHHCAQPVMERFGVPATARCSFALYNTRDEIDRLRVGVERIIRMFS